MNDLKPIAAVLSMILLVHAACAGPSAAMPGEATGPDQKARPAPGKGGYSPVSKEQLLGRHRCSATGPSRADFRFTFVKDHFRIEEEGKPIPKEVLEAVLGAGKTAAKIEGRFDLKGERLILTGIRADGKGDFKDAKIRTFNMRVVRFYFGEVQYVLGPREQE